MPSPKDSDEFAPSWRSADLDTIREACWQLLELAACRAAQPMHIGTLCSVARGLPDARSVVLRGCDAATRTLLCHTDARSPKVAQLEDGGPDGSGVTWVFYDGPRKVQLRLKGTATVHRQDELSDRRWADAQLSSRRAYLIDAPPGTPRETPGSGLPGVLDSRVPSQEESETGRPNFAVVQTRVTQLDWLFLAHSGHTRARFGWAPGGAASAGWIVP